MVEPGVGSSISTVKSGGADEVTLPSRGVGINPFEPAVLAPSLVTDGSFCLSVVSSFRSSDMDIVLGNTADDGLTVLFSSDLLEDDGREGSFVLPDVAESGRGGSG
jgi:hypothetical protein